MKNRLMQLGGGRRMKDKMSAVRDRRHGRRAPAHPRRQKGTHRRSSTAWSSPAGRGHARDVHGPPHRAGRGRGARLPAALAEDRQDRGEADRQGPPGQAVLPARPRRQGDAPARAQGQARGQGEGSKEADKASRGRRKGEPDKDFSPVSRSCRCSPSRLREEGDDHDGGSPKLPWWRRWFGTRSERAAGPLPATARLSHPRPQLLLSPRRTRPGRPRWPQRRLRRGPLHRIRRRHPRRRSRSTRPSSAA